MTDPAHIVHTARRIYLVGIGGIGMSALARGFAARGCHVSGYDRTASWIARGLEGEGIDITYDDAADGRDPQADLVIYTPAVPADHPQLVAYRATHPERVLKRAEVLGHLARPHRTVAVAGAHGKTTVSSMIAHVLDHAGRPVEAFLGGVLAGHDTNHVYRPGDDVVVVAEADEYDRSFLQLSPDVAVVTSVDTDHLDVYGDLASIEREFAAFVGCVRNGGQLITRPHLKDLAGPLPVTTYGHEPQADLHLVSRTVHGDGYRFVVGDARRERPFVLPLGGRHNVENALAVVAVCRCLGMRDDDIAEGLSTFRGIRRRFETVFRAEDLVLIDDYAHHPREIEALVESVRELHPRHRVVVIFQPHLFSRTRDLADGFARALDRADDVILLPVYPAREEPIPGVDEGLIADRMSATPRRMPADRVPGAVEIDGPTVWLTVGAGDIDRLVPRLSDILREHLRTTAS